MTHSLASTDQLPPHAEDAERGALGCIISSPDTALADLQEHADPASLFYDLRHRKLVEVILDLSNAGRPIDPVMLPGQLKERGNLEEVGGLGYVSAHMDATPSAASLGYFLGILVEYRQRRGLIAAATRISEAARGPDIKEAMAMAEASIYAVASGAPDSNDSSAKGAVINFINSVEEANASRGKPRGLCTGLVDLDRIVRGMKPGQLIVLGARPSEGKSALACQIAERVAVDDKQPVGFWSLEMTRDEVAGRIVAGRARIPFSHLQEGACTEAELKRMAVAAANVAASPLHIYDRPGLTITQLRSIARRSSRKHELKLIVVDYLGLLHGTERRKDRRDLELGEITSQLKELAKELQLPVLLLSQFNREYDKDRGREPRLSDLRDSGSIEQDADIVVLIHSEQPTEGPPPEMQRSKLLVKKNRNGRTGPVEVVFNRPLMRFETVTRE